MDKRAVINNLGDIWPDQVEAGRYLRGYERIWSVSAVMENRYILEVSRGWRLVGRYLEIEGFPELLPL